MSASAPRDTGRKNPAELYIKWKAGDKQGFFEYYDKSEEDPKKRQKAIDLSDGFFILDKDLFSITGFIDEKPPTNIISNEVRGMDDTLVVKGYKDKKATIMLTGTYTDLKPTVSGSKMYAYTRSIYVMLMDGRLAHIALSGAAFASWISVESNSKHANSLIKMSGVGEGNKGNVSWKFPIFEVVREATEAEWADILKLDSEILQPYLEWYFAKNKTSKASDVGHQQEEAFDQKNWRQYKLQSGSRLCELTHYQLRELSDSMIDAGDTDGAQFNCVSQAIVDYNQASKGWQDKADTAGKKLKDYTLAEINELLARIRPENPAKMALECAKEAKEEITDPVEEDDDIPF